MIPCQLSELCWVLAILGLLLVQPAAKSEPPPGKRAGTPSSRMDEYGDPLPEYACYRVGRLPFWCGPDTNFIAFAHDGKTLLSGDEHARFTVWDMATGRAVRQFVVPVYHKDEPAPFNGPLAALSPDGRLLAVSALHTLDSETDEHVALVDVGTGKVVQKLAEGGACYGLTFSRDGKVLAALHGASTVRCWRMPGGKRSGPIIHGPAGLDTIALSPDGKLLAGGDRNAYAICIWDRTTATQVRRLNLLRPGKDEDDYPLQLTFSPNGKVLACAEGRASVGLWDMTTGQRIRHFRTGDGRLRQVAFSPDGKLLLYGTQTKTHLQEVTSGKELEIPPIQRHGADLTVFAPNGKYLAVLRAPTFDIWELGKRTRYRPFGERDYIATAVAVSHDGRELAVGDCDGGIHMLDASNGREVSRFTDSRGPVFFLAFCPDGKSLLAQPHDDEVGVRAPTVWDLASGRRRRTLKPTPDTYEFVASSDGRLAASLGDKGIVRLFDVSTGKELRRWRVPELTTPFYFSCDSRFFIAGSLCLDVITGQVRRGQAEHEWADSIGGRTLTLQENSIRLRYGGTPHRRRTIPSAPDDLLAGSSSDGRMLVMADNKARIMLVEAATGKVRRILKGHRDLGGPEDIEQCLFFADGRRLVSLGCDGSVIVWNLLGPCVGAIRTVEQTSPAALRSLWQALADENAAAAYRAMCCLRQSPEAAVALLRPRLRPVPVPQLGQVDQLIAGLDDRHFAVREKSMAHLERLGSAVEATLQRAAKGNPSREVHWRATHLLRKLERELPSGDTLRSLRAIEVLEHIGSPEAIAVLRSLAKGAPDALLTCEAKASLDRLAARRGAANPVRR